ncbi:response regulator transcription factor [Chryseobacterium arachidis]|uniref:response regulator n=1 Tax=Chryseobacterium arachidis TaxID=1416778 RepID=UPI003606E414
MEDTEWEYEVFHASNLQQLTESIQENSIDVAIIDAHFPDGNSLSVLPEIKKLKPEIKILIFTGIDEATHSLKFINAGADGFLSKLNEEEEIIKAIVQILNEGEYISPLTQRLLMNSINNRNLINPLAGLTARELQVAKCMRTATEIWKLRIRLTLNKIR